MNFILNNKEFSTVTYDSVSLAILPQEHLLSPVKHRQRPIPNCHLPLPLKKQWRHVILNRWPKESEVIVFCIVESNSASKSF